MFFFQAAQKLDKSLQKLSAVKYYPTGLGDANVANSKHGGIYFFTSFLDFIVTRVCNCLGCEKLHHL